jgi:protein-tyrosine phosphatase
MQPPRSLLFVCTGNICRSPTAEGVMQHAARTHGLPLTLDSAGIASYHIGEAPDRRTQSVARGYGVELSGLRARKVVAADFTRFDLIFAMDAGHLAALERLRPQGSTAELALYLPYAGIPSPADMPDPYYGDEAGFHAVYDLCQRATQQLLNRWYGLSQN